MSQIKVNSIIPVSGVPTGGGGGIVQIVNAVATSSMSTTSTSFTDTNLTATITPTSASSKVLVYVSQSHRLRNTTANTAGADIRLVRGSTDLVKGPDRYAIWRIISSGAIDSFDRYNFHYLDSPNTTSATTYKTTCAVHSTAMQFYAQPTGGTDDGASYITLMEVSA